MEDDVGQLAGQGADPDDAAGAEGVGDVSLEGIEVRREEIERNAECPPDRDRLGVVPRSPIPRERLEPSIGHDDRRVDQRRMDPQG